jgi:hypothetical protein
MFRFALAGALLALMPVTEAQEQNADFDDSIRLDYYYVKTGQFASDTLTFDAGTTDSHPVQLSGIFSLNEKWTLYGSIPYVRKRLVDPIGYGTHNPNVDFWEYTPPDLRFVDDGEYHGALQDLTVGVQYLALDGPLKVSPYVSYGTPASDYPIYGGAIIGRGLNELHLGVSLEFTPYFSDWNFQADITYAFSEKVLGVDLDFWLMYLSASYYVTPRFAPRIFLTSRHAPNALRYPEDFEPYEEKYDNENGWRHDQTIKHEFVNAGVGFDYIVNERYGVSATYYRTLDAENLLEIDEAFTLGLMRRF